MGSYKDCEKIYIGSSDMAALVMVSPEKPEFLTFGQDGSYSAYIITDEAVGSHYRVAFRASGWLKIYDDEGLVLDIRASEITVYRAGNFGCIIRVPRYGGNVQMCYNPDINSSSQL